MGEDFFYSFCLTFTNFFAKIFYFIENRPSPKEILKMIRTPDITKAKMDFLLRVDARGITQLYTIHTIVYSIK